MKKILTLLTILTIAFVIPCFAVEPVVINLDQINEKYTFTLEDFDTPFATLDAFDAGDLARVVIVSLPEVAQGTLTYNDEPIETLPFGIDVANIDGLVFTPTSEFTGEASFTWRGKTADTNDQTIFTTKINVTNELADTTVNVTAYKNEVYTFKASDFSTIFNTLNIGDLSRGVIVTLTDAAQGTLKYNNEEISTLPFGFDIANVSKLTFTPAEDFTGFTTFTWRGKTADVNDQTIFTTKISITERPQMVALDKELTTDKNVTLISTLEANYAEGASFVVVAQPQHGTIENFNTATGEFQYIPTKDYVGADSFTFKTVIGEGNEAKESNVATVSIEILETEDVIPFYYVDMQDNWANYSASHLADMGIIVGESYNGDYFFNPDVKVTRADFLIAMLSVLDIRPDEEMTDTFRFADHDDIPDWLRPYVYKAYEEDIINGSLENGKLYFLPNNSITRAEAATIINNSIELLNNNEEDLEFIDAMDIPSWSLGAIKNMVGYQIINGYDDNTFKPGTTITRAELAEMLYKAIKEKENQAELAE